MTEDRHDDEAVIDQVGRRLLEVGRAGPPPEARHRAFAAASALLVVKSAATAGAAGGIGGLGSRARPCCR